MSSVVGGIEVRGSDKGGLGVIVDVRADPHHARERHGQVHRLEDSLTVRFSQKSGIEN